MSRDFQIAWPCPHMTVEEHVTLDDDRRSLPTRQPVAGFGTVRILVNDELFIPQGGLFSPGRLFSTNSGPFDITENEDQITVTTPRGSETVSFNVIGTTRLTADQVIRVLLRKNFSVALVENFNGHLLFTDYSTVGPDSYVEVGGSAASALGFGAITCGNRGGAQRRDEGRQVYPGWALASRPDTITNRFPQFTDPVLNNPVFKVTYSVPVNRCLRCGATFVENDYRFTQDGQSVLIENEDLLYQASLKILLTDRGSNPYHTWYGTTLRSRIGSKALAGVSAVISEDVRMALARLQTLQENQAKYQSVSFKERLYTVLQVQVQPHAQDPTTFLVEVTVQNASSEPITLRIVFTVPDVVALMGSNGLMLGTEIAGLGASRVQGALSDGR